MRDSRQLEDYKGTLAVVHRTTSSQEPPEKFTTIYLTDYPTKIAETHFGWVLPLTVTWSQIDEAYYVQLGDKQQNKLAVLNTFISISEPYPCPKIRKGTETRYRGGYWEFYSKKLSKWCRLEG
jgi:hypothetical protein